MRGKGRGRIEWRMDGLGVMYPNPSSQGVRLMIAHEVLEEEASG